MNIASTSLKSKAIEISTSYNKIDKQTNVSGPKTEITQVEASALDAQENIVKGNIDSLPAQTPRGNRVDFIYAKELQKRGGEVEYNTTTEKYKKYVKSFNKDEILALCDAKNTNPQIAKKLEVIFDSSITRNKMDSNANIHLSYTDASKIVKSAIENPEEFEQIYDLQKYAVFNKKMIKSIPVIIETMKNNPQDSKTILNKFNNLLENSTVSNINLNAIVASINNYGEYAGEIDELLEIPKNGWSDTKLNSLEKCTYTKEYKKAMEEEHLKYQEKQKEKERLEKEKLEQEKQEQQEKWDKFSEAKNKYENSNFFYKLTHKEPTHSDFGLPEPEYYDDGGFMEAMCDGLTKGTYYTSGVGRAGLASKYL